ncbi:hypothetical protein [Dethiobacter alkaliphilus]|uniref:hypothetical protein n=1 Tax=Dethiobacter alkaliphilus TaxID=427926 RepID=UPI002226FC71|nr:hypothetical protein [Dethiobacter alkaliphilus]MCW3491529.1 hypothetical protein [Dethiobacter alkaliphilus]
MQIKDLIKYIVVTLVGLLLLNLYSATLMGLRGDGLGFQSLSLDRAVRLHFFASAYCVLLGVLVEWRSVVKLVTREIKLKPNLLLVPGIIFLLVSLMHPGFIIIVLRQRLHLPFPNGGVGINMLIGPLLTSSTQNILSVISGILVIKGLHKSE